MDKAVKTSDKPSLLEVKVAEPASPPVLTRAQIMKSLFLKPFGPNKGRPVVGAGGFKPFRPPPDGTVAKPFSGRIQKNLRPPLERK